MCVCVCVCVCRHVRPRMTERVHKYKMIVCVCQSDCTKCATATCLLVAHV